MPAGATFLLGGCHAEARLDAADDVRAFLAAARSNDAARLRSYVDQKAVGLDIERQIDEGLTVLRKDQLSQGMDRLLQPSNFAVAVDGNPRPTKLPGRTTLALALRWQAPGKVCLPAAPGSEPCAITFRKEASGWKLTGMRAATFLGGRLPRAEPTGQRDATKQ